MQVLAEWVETVRVVPGCLHLASLLQTAKFTVLDMTQGGAAPAAGYQQILSTHSTRKDSGAMWETASLALSCPPVRDGVCYLQPEAQTGGWEAPCSRHSHSPAPTSSLLEPSETFSTCPHS